MYIYTKRTEYIQKKEFIRTVYAQVFSLLGQKIYQIFINIKF